MFDQFKTKAWCILYKTGVYVFVKKIIECTTEKGDQGFSLVSPTTIIIRSIVVVNI